MSYLLLLWIFPVAFIIQQAFTAIYNLYFHPLSNHIGPRLWIAFPVLRRIEECKGSFNQRMRVFHEQYGPVLRFADNDLSFATASAWRDIYGHGHGPQQWPKISLNSPGATPHIIFSDDADHARYRKALAHGFSEQSLRQQENLIKGYVDRMMRGIREEAEEGRDVDMTMWYNLATFDIISDLAFGEPSTYLEGRTYGKDVETMLKFVQIVPFVQLAKFYPTVWAAVMLFMKKNVGERVKSLLKMGTDAVEKRKSNPPTSGRADFLDSMMTSKEVLTDDELASNSQMLFLAGSETTATLLAGVTYWMLKTPETMLKAKREVRSTFDSEDEITPQSVGSKLPYTLACLEEGLRVYSPTPSIMQRVVITDNAMISGTPVPKGTLVGVHQEGTNFASYNFHRAGEFVPERWLSDAMTNEKSEFFKDNREARQTFGVGPRNCIGKNLAFSEMRPILARLLWNFDMELVDKSLDWSKQKAFALREKGPLMVSIKAVER